MLLGLCACGAPKSIDAACKKADSLVEKWDRNSKYLSGYESRYEPQVKMYFVTTYSLTADDETDFARQHNAERNCKFVYKELESILSDFDIRIIVMMNDENQNVYYATMDNKPIDPEELR